MKYKQISPVSDNGTNPKTAGRSGNKSLLSLSCHEPYNSGFYRDSYIHPENPDLILKIVRATPESPDLNIFRSGRKKPSDSNQLEYEMWEYLKNNDFDKSGYFSEVKGWVQTDLGPALCVERLNSDEDFPPIVLSSIGKPQASKFDAELKNFIVSSLDEFFRFVVRNGIYSCAWRLENLAICKQNGKLKLKSFDTKAITIKEWLPISRYSKIAARMKIRRRTDKLRIRMHQNLFE